jgi:hypothetical protein
VCVGRDKPGVGQDLKNASLSAHRDGVSSSLALSIVSGTDRLITSLREYRGVDHDKFGNNCPSMGDQTGKFRMHWQRG